jgi:hypothetical protein
MILIDCPSCEGPLPASQPLPDEVTCEACTMTWEIVDPDPTEALLAA